MMSEIDITRFMAIAKTNCSRAKSYLKKSRGVFIIAIDMFYNERNHGEDTSDNRVSMVADNRFVDERVHEDYITGEMDDKFQSSLRHIKKPHTLSEFKIMWKEAEACLGVTTEEIENSPAVKEGNGKVADADQSFAMYGRIRMGATEKILKLLELKPADIFIDIGHGIGSVVMQAAFTRGCESRGIELMEPRHLVATQFNHNLQQQKAIKKQQNINNIDCHQVGEIKLISGNFKKQKHNAFITGANKLLVNNASEIFSGRSSEGSDGSLDDYIASSFARTRPGSIMVSLEQITALGRSRSEANADRKINNLSERNDASFFEYKKVNIGNCAVTWTDVNDITVWVYKRIFTGKDTSSFVCNDAKCQFNTQYTSVVQPDDEQSENISLLRDCCIYCDQKRLVCKRTSKCPEKHKPPEANLKRRKTGQSTKKVGSQSSRQQTKRHKTDHSTSNTTSVRKTTQYKPESPFNSSTSGESSHDEY